MVATVSWLYAASLWWALAMPRWEQIYVKAKNIGVLYIFIFDSEFTGSCTEFGQPDWFIRLPEWLQFAPDHFATNEGCYRFDFSDFIFRYGHIVAIKNHHVCK